MGAEIKIRRGVTHVPFSTSASVIDTQIDLDYPQSATVAPRWAFVRLLTNNGYVQAVNKDGNYMTNGCTAGDQSAVVSLVKPFAMLPSVYVRVECGPATSTWNGATTEVDKYVSWEVWEFVSLGNATNEIYIPGATSESQAITGQNNINTDGSFTIAEAPKCVPFTRGISWTQETAGTGLPGGYTDKLKHGSHSLSSGVLFNTPITLVVNQPAALHATERATVHFDNVYFKGSDWNISIYPATFSASQARGATSGLDLTTPSVGSGISDWSRTLIAGCHTWDSDDDLAAGFMPNVDPSDTDLMYFETQANFSSS